MALPDYAMQPEPQLVMRPLTLDDAPPAVALFNVLNRLYVGHEIDNAGDLRRDWSVPGFDLEHSALGVFEGRRMVGFVQISDTSSVPVNPEVWFRVHPDYFGTSLGRDLLAWGEQRARQVFGRLPPDVRVVLQADVYSTDAYSRHTLQAAGFAMTDHGWLRMVIEFDEAPQRPQWPTGYSLTTAAELSDTRPIYRALKAAFLDHRGHVREDFEAAFSRWHAHLTSDPLFEPELLFGLVYGGEIVGTLLCRPQSWGYPERAYISSLGVVREHRRKGLAKTLLLHGFDTLWRRGARAVDLYVDNASPTGAHRLYEQAGMRVDIRFHALEKELRPGRSLTDTD